MKASGLTMAITRRGSAALGTTVIDVPVDELPDPDNPEHVDEPLPNDEPVCYVVTAYAESGPAPATPTNPGVRPGNGKNTVFWDAVPGASGYKVKKGYPPGQPPASGPSESEPTAEVCGTPNATPPETPTGFTATAGDEQVSLAWGSNAEAAEDFAFYALHFGLAADFTPGEGNRIGGDITGTSYVHTGRTNGVEYFYKLAAVDTAGNGSGYAADSATPADVTAPGTPTDFTATAVGSDQVDLSWVAPADADLAGYQLEWSPNGTDTWTPVSGSPLAAGATTYSHTGLTASTAYFYRIRAFDEVPNYSGYASANATTLAAAAMLVFQGQDSGGSAGIWKAAPDGTTSLLRAESVSSEHQRIGWDGSWIYHIRRNAGDGQGEVWKFDVDGANASLIIDPGITHGTANPHVDHYSGELIYQPGTGIRKCTTAGASDAQIFSNSMNDVAFMRDGTHFVTAQSTFLVKRLLSNGNAVVTLSSLTSCNRVKVHRTTGEVYTREGSSGSKIVRRNASLGSAVDLITGLSGATNGFCLDETNGFIYVATGTPLVIKKYNLTTGAYISDLAEVTACTHLEALI